MAATQAQLDAICNAIANGASYIEYQDRAGGRKVKRYMSLDEMLAVKRQLQAELNPNLNKRNIHLSGHRKGLR